MWPLGNATKNTYPRSLFRTYLVGSLAHRGRRRSRRLMTEQGAVPDNGIAVEPREAQRPTSLAARTPQAATPGNRESPWVRSNGPSQGPCGASQAPGAVASRVYPTCASNMSISALAEIGRAPSPRFRGEKENRDTGTPAARKTRSRASGALAALRPTRTNQPATGIY